MVSEEILSRLKNVFEAKRDVPSKEAENTKWNHYVTANLKHNNGRNDYLGGMDEGHGEPLEC